MKKIIRLTESELNRIIKKVVEEQQYAKEFEKRSSDPQISSGFQNLGSASFEKPETEPESEDEPEVPVKKEKKSKVIPKKVNKI